jgi:hypothetical protein
MRLSAEEPLRPVLQKAPSTEGQACKSCSRNLSIALEPMDIFSLSPALTTCAVPFCHSTLAIRHSEFIPAHPTPHPTPKTGHLPPNSRHLTPPPLNMSPPTTAMAHAVGNILPPRLSFAIRHSHFVIRHSSLAHPSVHFAHRSISRVHASGHLVHPSGHLSSRTGHFVPSSTLCRSERNQFAQPFHFAAPHSHFVIRIPPERFGNANFSLSASIPFSASDGET